MGMTNKEKTLDWLYRLRSKIYVYMPKEWLIPMDKALDVAIDTVKREEMLEDWTKKCRKFEADYENRLKADMVAMLEELISEADELEDPKYILETSELPLDVDGTTLPLETYALQCYCRGGEEVIDIVEKKINELNAEREVEDGNVD